MTGPICANCGFHNEPGARACVSCGYMLAGAESTPGGRPPAESDPQAMTQLVASVEPCWNCGAPNEQTRTFCQACGQQLRSATQPYPAVAPAIAPPGEAAQGAPASGAPASPGSRWRGGPRRTAVREPSRRSWMPFLVAGAFGALLVAAAFVLAGLIGERLPGELLGGLGGDRTGSAASPAAARTPAGDTGPTSPPATPGDDTGAGFRCETQTVSASEPGAWTVVRARWGQRPRFDYISFVLRRGGSSDDTATVTAELVPLDEVESRFDVDGPDDGDSALVLTFESPVDLSGPFGRKPNQRALQSFQLVRSEGVVYAVLGVSGTGCFDMTAPGWENGRPRNVEVRLEIERG